MYIVYIIKSTFKNWNYVGFTKDINVRLNEHNFGAVKSTKPYRPFNLNFAQLQPNRIKARRLEIFLKVRFNKESILNLISRGW